MLPILYSVVICDLLLVFVSSETPLEIEVSNHLKSLEAQTYFPINLHISSLTAHLESLVTNFTILEIESTEVIIVHAESVKEDIHSVSELLNELGAEIVDCEENVSENFRQVFKTAKEDLKSCTLDGITKAQAVVTEARNILMTAQNYTLAAKLTTENCLLLLDDSECLLEALKMTMLLEHLLPKIISVVARQHESQLILLEDEVLSKMDGVVVMAFDKNVELLDEFLMCILQGE